MKTNQKTEMPGAITIPYEQRVLNRNIDKVNTKYELNTFKCNVSNNLTILEINRERRIYYPSKMIRG